MRCPLCLKELTTDDEFERFCTEHPDKRETFKCFSEAKKIFCLDGKCPHNRSVGIPGVFLRHVGCGAENPFWVTDKDGKARVLFPETSGEDSTITTTIDGNSVQIDHWEVALLRMAPNDAQEMWFPLMLMRAMTETIKSEENGREKKIGALVELAGAAWVGKTVLAIQAMDQKGYQLYRSDLERLEVSDYVCSRAHIEGSTDNPFLETLYILNRMRTNEMKDGKADVDVPSPTKPAKEPGDLKVAFIKPSQKSIAASQKAELKQTGIGQVLGDIRNALTKMLSSPDAESPPFWYTVAFYDTAGEIQKRQYSTLRSTVEKAVGKVAVLVDALEVIGGESRAKGSIQVAVQRIRQIKDREDLQWCLVVTQIDRVQQALEEGERRQLASIIVPPNNDTHDHSRACELLIALLDKRSDQDKTDLKDVLLDAEPPIFFIGTENLPEANQRLPQHPKTYGLAKFICWCLDIDWADINQRRSKSL